MRFIEKAEKSTYSLPARNIVWTVPNIISFIRIATIPLIAWLIAANHLWWALLVMALSASSDGLDGYLARRFNQVSHLGQLLDPIADRLLIISCTLALAIANVLPWWLVIIIFMRDLLLGGQILILSNHGYGPLPVHFAGKTSTFLLMSAIPVMMIAQTVPRLTVWYLLLHGLGLALCWWGIGLYYVSGVIYLIQGHKLIANKEADPREVVRSHMSKEA